VSKRHKVACLGLVSILGGLLGLGCRPLFSISDCYRGLGVGQVVEVELIEENRRDGPYAYWEQGDRGAYPSCDGVDGLGPGTRLRFQLVSTGAGSSDCLSYQGIPLEPLSGVDAVGQQPRGGAGRGQVVSSDNRYSGPGCADARWRFFAVRHISLDDDPFGEVLTPGVLPPVLIKREINGCCIDWWVGVVRHVEPTDAGVDGG